MNIENIIIKIKHFFSKKEVKQEPKEFTFDKTQINGIKLPVKVEVKVKHLRQALINSNSPLLDSTLEYDGTLNHLRKLYLLNEGCLLATTFKMYFGVPYSVRLGQGGGDFTLSKNDNVQIYKTGDYFIDHLQLDYFNYLNLKDQPEAVLRVITVSPK